MKKKVFLAVAMMAMLSGAAMAQTAFTLKLGGGFPMGDFADAKADYDNGALRWGLWDKHTDGGAGLGFNLGAEWCIPVASVNGLGVVVSLDAFYNGLNEDLTDFFADYKVDLENNYDSWSLTLPNYLNFPVMVGAKYEYPLTSGISIYGAGAVGANLRIVTPFKRVLEGTVTGNITAEQTMTIKFDPAVSFAFRLAGGVTFAEKYSVELGYYALGAGKVKDEVKVVTEYSSTYQDDTNKDKETLKSITPTLFTLRLGIKF